MLTATDRCDRCGGRAIIVAFIGACELMFCTRHGRQYMDALTEVADDIYDASDDPVIQPSLAVPD